MVNAPAKDIFPPSSRRVGAVETAAPLRRLAAALTLTAALAATLVAGGCASDLPGIAPSAGSSAAAGQARHQVEALTVATARSMAGYVRDARFGGWASQGNGCDTREVVLKRDGTDVKTDADCHVTSGKWRSLYDDKVVTDAESVDIDHMVPLADAWRSGADSWTDAKRAEFANDLARPQLLAVTAATNRAKGDQDPSLWKPPLHSYYCTYAARWITVKTYWQLTVTSAEKDALVDMLATCA